MPNGHRFTPEESARIGRYFARLEPELSAFAHRWNLVVERQHRGEPICHLLFRHPAGGTGKIELERVDDEVGRIRIYWWRDSYDEGIRFLRMDELPSCPLSLSTISDVLDRAARTILGWPAADLQAHPGFKESWHKWLSRQDFDAMEERYSLPTPQ